MRITRVVRNPIQSVNIELTGEEAGILLKVSQHIGGHPETPRGLFSDTDKSFDTQLRRIGVQEYEADDRYAVEGSIMFRYKSND